MDVSLTTQAGSASNNSTSKLTSAGTGSGASFSGLMSEALNTGGSAFIAEAATQKSSPVSFLTTPESSQLNRPGVKDFMDKTGLNYFDSTQIIAGVIGSNTDTRDWSAIMASADPVTTARQATAEMYGQANPPVNPLGTYMKPADTVDKAGNFAVRLLFDPIPNPDGSKKILDSGVKLVDNAGLILRDAGTTPEQIAKNAWLFGFDTSPLASLATAAGTVSSSLELAVQSVPAVKISNLGEILSAPISTHIVNASSSLANTVSLSAQSAPAAIVDTNAQSTNLAAEQSPATVSSDQQQANSGTGSQNTSVVTSSTETSASTNNTQISALIGAAIANSASQSTLDKLLNS